MRKKIVAGNWKMNTLIEEGAALAKNIADRINEVPSDVQLILAPPFTHLDRVGGIIKGTPAALSLGRLSVCNPRPLRAQGVLPRDLRNPQ